MQWVIKYAPGARSWAQSKCGNVNAAICASLKASRIRKGARPSQLRPYRPICFTASRIGVGGILSTPLNGVYISRMMKIAEETAIALRANVAIVVELGAANGPKLRKMAA